MYIISHISYIHKSTLIAYKGMGKGRLFNLSIMSISLSLYIYGWVDQFIFTLGKYKLVAPSEPPAGGWGH